MQRVSRSVSPRETYRLESEEVFTIGPHRPFASVSIEPGPEPAMPAGRGMLLLTISNFLRDNIQAF